MPNEIVITNASVQEMEVGSTPVSSVNGKAGVVRLTQDDIPDGEEYVRYSKSEQEKLREMSETGGGNGVGIESVEQTTTSTEDGGTNVITVTLTDGTESTFDVKNGSKGTPGYTPIRGTDYWTPQDIAEIKADVVAMVGDIDSVLDAIIAKQTEVLGGDT